MSLVPYQNSLAVPQKGPGIQYLTRPQLDALTSAFRDYYDSSTNKKKLKGRYWLTYLLLRHTGARIGEVTALDDKVDIDFRNAEVKLVTLKQRARTKKGNKSSIKRPTRIVPVPYFVISEIATYLAEFPDVRGKVFKIYQSNFYVRFRKIALSAGIPVELAHPHVLRHTRAIELLRAGVPVTVVQDLLGHSALTTTAVYLRISGQEAKAILREKGLL